MLDRSCQRRARTGHLSPRDTSTEHYWLMRRECLDAPVPSWPNHLHQVAFSRENAANVHDLLSLTDQDVGAFDAWLPALERDPEYDVNLWVIVADHEGIVGVAQCWTSAFIRHLGVHPRARRQGIGRLLLHQALAIFARRGEGWLDLKVMENNLPARRLYEQAGMHYISRSALGRA
jgi:ribosomal protein S18 acetylase RimI-like enzyme